LICSTVIPTIGRASLAQAVHSVLQQELAPDDFEVIVVNDSGRPLAYDDWMGSKQVRILHTNRLNRSVARNTGASVARGRYLHFLDDDDWMLPGAFQQLRAAAADNVAGWIYGGFQLVDNSGGILHQFQPDEFGNIFLQTIAAEWIPLQASWIDASAFFFVGGFAPLNTLEGGYEDIDLSRMIAKRFDFCRTPEIVAAIRYGDEGSTTDYNNSIKQNRQSREKNLDADGAFRRLRDSAQASPAHKDYWHGRVAYFYLVSIPWQLKRRHVMKAISRFMHAVLAFVLSILYLFSREFWHGVTTPHYNRVRTTLSKMDDRLYGRTTWQH
jgi:glycosyltransferase involved in cell wall biosynthesis